MGVQENGLTLEGLAQRLESLERENAELRHKVATLEGSGTHRDEVAESRGADSHQDENVTSEFVGQLSRRSLLSKAGAAAVAAVAAGALLKPRAANASHYSTSVIEADFVGTHLLGASSDTGTPVVSRSFNGNAWPGLDASSNGSKPAVYASNVAAGQGVLGLSTNGRGVEGRGVIGVWGFSATPGQAAVYAEHPANDGPGVVADGRGPDYAGVLGRNSVGTGIKGEGGTGVWGVGSDAQQAGVKGEGPTGVWGFTSRTSFAGVYGEHTGTSGIGTVGIGKGEAGAGVLGRNDDGTGVWGKSSKTGYGGITGQHTGSSGYGVIGLGTGSANSGVLGRNSSGIGVGGEGAHGVHGKATGGYGGLFEGGKAQLKITPKGTAGRPTAGTHVKGEIYMDSAANLFVCVSGGTPGTWRKVSTTAV